MYQLDGEIGKRLLGFFEDRQMSDTSAAFLLAVKRFKYSSTITLTRFYFVRYDLSRKSVGQYILGLVWYGGRLIYYWDCHNNLYKQYSLKPH
jgi:hypothetical protein